MITITSNQFAHEIEAKGHANFGDYGKDIICASVTTLMCALADILCNEDINCSVLLDDGGGKMNIKALPKLDQVHDCNIMFKTITGALKDIADAYPENVTFKEM